MSSERAPALLGLALALSLPACEVRDRVLHPSFGARSQIVGAPAPRPGALSLLDGMYQVAAGGDRFGITVAGHAASGGFSLFTDAHENYAILSAGCLDAGTRVVLEGYWRYAGGPGTGLLRLTVGPPEVALGLCSSAPPPGPLPPPQLDGALGTGDGSLREPLSFAFERPLVATAGRFWVAARNGACQTIDDCGASENSLPSLRMAESFGASDVEIDIRLTADGVPILFHDEQFSPRLADGVFCHGSVADYTLADVRANCRLKWGEELPTLEEALATVVNDTGLTGLWLDVKVPGAVAPTLQLMARYAALAAQQGRTLVIAIGLADESLVDAYLAAGPPAGTRCLVELDPADVRRVGCQFWGPRWTRGPMVADVQQLQAENRAVMFWTIDERQFMDLYLRQAHPNGMLSNRPGLLFHRFQTVGTLPPPFVP